MKKEKKLEASVFVPPRSEAERAKGALCNASALLHRALWGAYTPFAEPSKTEKRAEAARISADPKGELPTWGKERVQDMGRPGGKVPLPSVDSLIRGGVLPANQAFQTVLSRAGDTVNQEENTLLQAVSLSMADQTEAFTAGMEANLALQREILRAILGIRIGDETIARANERYCRKMAVMEGGDR